MPQFEKCLPTDRRIPKILELLQDAFAYMEDQIDPPSSMNQLTVGAIAAHCNIGEVWVCGDEPRACVFLRNDGDRLYLGKLAVSTAERGRGLARQLIELSESRALRQGILELEVEVRIELSQNHKVFEKLGFVKVGEDAHDGYERPTFVIMRKHLCN